MKQPVWPPVTGETTLQTAQDYVAAVASAIGQVDLATVDRVAEALYAAHAASRSVYCMGNGGSAATAAHFAGDLSRLTEIPERSRQMKVWSLSSNSAVLTACANDHGFDQVFVEQLRGRLEPGDVVVGISTSGASPNVLEALQYARTRGAVTVGVTGLNGDRLRRVTDEAITIRSSSVQVIEDTTVVVNHLLCLLTRQRRLVGGE